MNEKVIKFIIQKALWPLNNAIEINPVYETGKLLLVISVEPRAVIPRSNSQRQSAIVYATLNAPRITKNMRALKTRYERWRAHRARIFEIPVPSVYYSTGFPPATSRLRDVAGWWRPRRRNIDPVVGGERDRGDRVVLMRECRVSSPLSLV